METNKQIISVDSGFLKTGQSLLYSTWISLVEMGVPVNERTMFNAISDLEAHFIRFGKFRLSKLLEDLSKEWDCYLQVVNSRYPELKNERKKDVIVMKRLLEDYIEPRDTSKPYGIHFFTSIVEWDEEVRSKFVASLLPKLKSFNTSRTTDHKATSKANF